MTQRDAKGRLAIGKAGVVFLATCASLVLASRSQAAVTIGHTGGDDTGSCGSGRFLFQSIVPAGNPSYQVPAGGGVLTSWSMQAYVAEATVKLKVVSGGNGPWVVVGESPFMKLTPLTLNTFPLSPGIPVKGGDRLGLAMPPIVISGQESRCTETIGLHEVRRYFGDPPVGSSAGGTPLLQRRLNVAATVESDADGDGFGDETQDLCPANATTQGDCPPAPKCLGKPATLTGSSKPETLKGTAKADVIAGRGGNDTLRGLGGNDRLCGGNGKDLLIGGKEKDRLSGAGGADIMRGGPGRDRFRGGPGKDRVRDSQVATD